MTRRSYSTRALATLIGLAAAALMASGMAAAQQQQNYVDPAILKQMLPKVSYSADRSMEFTGKDVPKGTGFQSKVYYRPLMERSEMNISGFSTVTIIRYDKDLLWTYSPMLGQVSEITLDSFSDEDTKVPADALKPAGTEVRDGRTLTLYKYSNTDEDGTVSNGTFYMTEENIPYRQEMTFQKPGEQPGSLTMQLSNLTLGDQPAELFEKPEGTGGVAGIPNLGALLRQSQAPPAARPAPATSASPAAPAATPAAAPVKGAQTYPVDASGIATFTFTNPSGAATPLTVALAEVEGASGSENIYWRALTPLQGPAISMPLKGLLSDKPGVYKHIIVYDAESKTELARFQPTLAAAATAAATTTTPTTGDIATQAATDAATETARQTTQDKVGRFFKNVLNR